MSERRCKRCERTLPLEAFNRYKDGHQWWCRECFKAYFRERGRKHLDQVRASRDARRDRAHEHVLLHLRDTACVDCGERDPLVLEFDHTGEKITEVATLVTAAKRPELIDVEMAKCNVVCCNCHRRRTYLRRGTTRTVASTARIKNTRVRRNVALVYGLLEKSQCVDCGVADALVLEFDHFGVKRKGVMRMAWDGYGQEAIQIEMNKCVVRCANCHRKKTHGEQRSFRYRTATSIDAPAKLAQDQPL